MIADLLPLTTVQVAKESITANGMGSFSTTTTLTTLPHAQIWQAGASDQFLSEKITKLSSHVLICKSGDYSWTVNDRHAVYGGDTFKIVGRADDVINKSVITVVALELLE